MRRKIKDIADIIIGYQHRGEPISIASDGTHQVVQIKDLQKDSVSDEFVRVPTENRLSTSSLYRVTPKSKAEAYEVKEDDVLFLSRGARYLAVPLVQNYVWPYPKTWEGVIASYYFYILRLKTGDVTPEYLAWVLNQERAQAEMEAVSQGSHMKMIKKEDFANIAVSVPAFKKQCDIITLHHLSVMEGHLVEQIQQKRTAMVDTLCTRAAADSN